MHIKLYQILRDQQSTKGKYRGGNGADDQHQAAGTVYVDPVAGTPKLGQEDGGAGCDAEQCQIQQEEDLVCGAGSSHCAITQTADHYHVDHIDRRGNQLLNGYRQCNGKGLPQKVGIK